MKVLQNNGFLSIYLAIILSGTPLILLANGRNPGQTWTPEILTKQVAGKYYMPDFSYAGYHWSEEPLPEAKGTEIHVEDFGAVPDDGKDDTEALKKAFTAAHQVQGPVVLKLPRGKFILKEILYIERSHFVLQGAGSDPDQGTTLYIPEPLLNGKTPVYLNELKEYLQENDKRQVEPERGVNKFFSLYSWAGAYIWTNYPGERGKPYLDKYNPKPVVLAAIQSGKRGDHVFMVNYAGKLKPGQIVRINWYNKEGEKSSLIQYLYNNQDLKIGSRHWETPDIPLTKQEVTIDKIEGRKVFIKEPLLHDLRPEWFPDITEWKYISEIGIENIGFEFIYQEYNYHHVEPGNNAIYLTNTAHSWVRNVRFRNGDNGILTDCCANVTMENIETYGRQYHYAVHYGDCYNMLARNLYIQAPVVHTFTFNTGSRCCVYTNCMATRMPTLDQHAGLNYQNLFDNLLIYEDDPGHNQISMGGASYWRPTHAAFPVFWNIKIHFLYKQPNQLPIHITGVTDGPSARLVGVSANYPLSIAYGPDAYMEGINRPNIAVPSLFEYQLLKRGYSLP